MKKTDFVKAVAEKTWVSQDVASRVLSAQIETITEELQSDGEVNITGFGVFKVSYRAERKWVNPRTWEALVVPAMKTPVFKSGKTFKDALKK